MGKKGSELPRRLRHLGSLVMASWGIGLLSLRQGDLPRAIPMLERAMGLCQGVDIPLRFPWVAPALGAAYTLAGRAADAVPCSHRRWNSMTATDNSRHQVLCCLCLGGGASAGRPPGGSVRPRRARAGARSGAPGTGPPGLCPAPPRRDIAARREPIQTEQAEIHYRQALTLAAELGMRPLQAHCHRGLGMLHRRTGQQAQSRTELLAAITLYRAMEMPFWLPQTEAALSEWRPDDEPKICTGPF